MVKEDKLVALSRVQVIIDRHMALGYDILDEPDLPYILISISFHCLT